MITVTLYGIPDSYDGASRLELEARLKQGLATIPGSHVEADQVSVLFSPGQPVSDPDWDRVAIIDLRDTGAEPWDTDTYLRSRQIGFEILRAAFPGSGIRVRSLEPDKGDHVSFCFCGTASA